MPTTTRGSYKKASNPTSHKPGWGSVYFRYKALKDSEVLFCPSRSLAYLN